MRKWLLLLIILNALNSHAQSVQFKNFNTNNGLLSSTVYNIFEDSKGFIWLATSNGANRYDGKTFENFTTEDGLSDNEVLKIREDSKGRIWFLTFNGKLSYYLDGIIYNTENSELLRKAICRSSFVNFFEDSNHNLWFSTNSGEVLSISENHIRYYNRDEDQVELTSIQFYEDDYNNLWAINKSRIYRIRDFKFKYAKPEHLPISYKTFFYDKPNRIIYFICKDGLTSIKNGKERFIRHIPNSLINKGISSILIENNKIWLTLLGNGVQVYDRDNEEIEYYLEDKYASNVIKDRNQNVWISTIDNGLYLLTRKARNFIHYTNKDFLTSEAVYSISKDEHNRIWLGLRNGQINVLEKDKASSIEIVSNGSIYNPILQIAYNKVNPGVWFMSENGICKLNGRSFPSQLKFNIQPEQFNFALKSFDFNSEGKLAVAMSSGLYYSQPEISSENFLILKNTNFKTIIPKRTFCVAYDKNDYLWFAQMDGLHILKGKTIKNFTNSSPALKDRIVHIFCDPSGYVFASTSSNGVLVFKDYKLLRIITTKDGLNSNSCVKSYFYNKKLWVLTNKGVSRLENITNVIRSTSFSVENGLLTNEVNDILIDSSFVYLATNKGLTKINKIEQIDYFPDLPIYFKKLIVNGREQKITFNQLIELGHNQNNIQVSFTAINFEDPDKVVYGYRIRKEDNWIETANNSLEFVSLEPGNYQIQVRARDINGLWGKSIEINLKIATPYYKTFPFIIVMLMLLIFISILIYNRYNKIKTINEEKKLLNQSKMVTLEQQALQAMMNPHFIFNVMNSIQYFINTQDKTTANKLLTGFARLIRKNMDIVNKGQISLDEEIEYLKLYLQLESLRYGNKLSYELIIDDNIEAEEIMIPSMLLQPFIENAIWHGIMPKDDKGNIHITMSQDHQLLRIVITDDGVGIENSLKVKNEEYISRGMSITQERISLINQLSGSEINIQVNQRPEGGTIVRVNIPLA